MQKSKVSLEPTLHITRVHELVVIEFTCEKEDLYKCGEYSFNEAEDKAIRFVAELKWVAKIVKGNDFSFYANEEEVIIDRSDLTSIAIATGFVGCYFSRY